MLTSKSFGPVFAPTQIYVKAQEFKLSASRAVFSQPGNMQLTVSTDYDWISVTEAEVVLTVGLVLQSANANTELARLKIVQAGEFRLDRVAPAEVTRLLEVAAPRILLPYARAGVSDALSRANLTPFLLPDIDWAYFQMLRKAHMAQAHPWGGCVGPGALSTAVNRSEQEKHHGIKFPPI